MQMNVLLSVLLLSLSFLSCSDDRVRKYTLEVVEEYPHDVTAYTQGLFFHNGQLYESTGLYGRSTFRRLDLDGGTSQICLEFDKKYFVEGSVVMGDDLYLLTWTNKVAFVYDMTTLEYKSTWSYPREGWGITTDGKQLIASDGTAYLYFMNGDFAPERKQLVTIEGRPVRWLNELEYIDGKVWANVYTSDEIVMINPKNGKVVGVIDCRGLLPKSLHASDTDVLNGIAYDQLTGKLYLTGKNWPKLYEVRLVERK